MLPKDYPDRKKIVDGYLNEIPANLRWRRDWDWDRYRYSTRLFIVKMALNGKSKKEIVGTLDKMFVVERAWMIDHVAEYPWFYNRLQVE